jgi:SAM-dependent methyltransferase
MRSKEEIHAYWRNPADGINDPKTYANEKDRQRTETLVSIIERLPIAKNARILEIGCNVGRNLEGLRLAGYDNLWGLEINKNAIELMRRHYPELSACIVVASVEDKIPEIPDDHFELVFTMAVLEHIHPSSEWVFAQMARITRFLITIEDEYTRSWRHKPRNYERVFSRLGLKQIGMGAIKGLNRSFVGRAFRKEMVR